MLMPKRVKHRKVHKGRIRGKAMRGNRVAFGEWGLQSLEAGRITARQIEASRVAAVRAAPGAKVHIRLFPHKPVTAKPAETRMGKGKGDVDHWVAVVRPGTIMFELAGVTREEAVTAFNRVSHKLPLRVRMVGRKVV